jgi:hypothetical protein
VLLRAVYRQATPYCATVVHLVARTTTTEGTGNCTSARGLLVAVRTAHAVCKCSSVGLHGYDILTGSCKLSMENNVVERGLDIPDKIRTQKITPVTICTTFLDTEGTPYFAHSERFIRVFHMILSQFYATEQTGFASRRRQIFIFHAPRSDRLWGLSDHLYNGYRRSIPLGWRDWAVKLTTHFCLVPIDKIRGIIPPFFAYSFITWCSLKHKNSFVLF